MRAAPLLLLLAVSPLAAQAPTIKNPKKDCAPLAKIDSIGLMTDVFKIADDSTKGRTIGSVENEKVRLFLARRFQDVGLRTIGDFWIHPVPSRSGVTSANVVGMIKGTTFPDEYIVVTGHYDHIGMAGAPGGRCRAIGADSICNGADDNASGTAALAILAEYFVKLKPKHSIVFAAVDGEEAGGMAGSNGFVNTPTVPLDKILLNVNLDMVSRNVNHELYAAGATKYPQLLPLVEETENCSPVNMKLGHDGLGNTRDDWTNQSDQGSFHKKGIPFIYFGVEDHPDYHKAGDSPEKIMPGFYVGAVQTAADFIQRFDKKPVARK